MTPAGGGNVPAGATMTMSPTNGAAGRLSLRRRMGLARAGRPRQQPVGNFGAQDQVGRGLDQKLVAARLSAGPGIVIGAAVEQHLAIRTKNAFRTVAPISILARYLQLHGGAFPTPEDEVKAMAYLLTTTLRGYRGGSSSSSVN